MTYGYENLKLEKGMYAQSGKSFSRVLEEPGPERKLPRHGAGGPGRLPASAQAL